VYLWELRGWILAPTQVGKTPDSVPGHWEACVLAEQPRTHNRHHATQSCGTFMQSVMSISSIILWNHFLADYLKYMLFAHQFVFINKSRVIMLRQTFETMQIWKYYICTKMVHCEKLGFIVQWIRCSKAIHHKVNINNKL